MAERSQRKTFFVVQGFSGGRQGHRMDTPIQARSEASARRQAERLSERKSGVIAFSRTGDPTTGEFDEPVVLASYGRIPGNEDGLPF
ncbi:hypothetical protein [Methylobacterium gnaphalii]|uniref:Uncharacterized protein n=1 Tax=Methylobacterium gnaphalii TaxID=1010610 RepID=A0A512JP15_9HYPH|nr:hypothetical protein [Methylobacterium gnaphalii]GEP11689.1 hypothetical protein MGN01_35340 [Methylobacterium gnaphalii]GJD68796.1 hypothetical protein MMMDOFMJ_1720 [Methylobacterium gnaphalii]GLS50187.1 hypothetical protein GCM10007885_30390 [Methylobacterium gnaphalii]